MFLSMLGILDVVLESGLSFEHSDQVASIFFLKELSSLGPFVFIRPGDLLLNEADFSTKQSRRSDFRHLSRLSFACSHDLRNPSAAMIGILDVVLESGLPPEQSEQVRQVKDCAVHQLNLLNEILDVSKVGHDLSN